uniref:Guanylate kinase n=1 Tax=Lygus hesperus TaxID=30085 RepID=A0A0A9Y572_LYGHE
MWNEMYKSPGPSFPGWKFRPPPQGGRLNQVGSEEFAESFKNLQLEADRASKKVQLEEPRQNKFSDYMRKIKSGSKTRDAETSPARMEEHTILKKIYSDQLDAMREKALASIRALDAETRGSDGDISLEVVKDGVSRQYRGMSSTDMLKNAVESLQQHRKASFNNQKSENGTFADRKTGYEFAQGDRLYRNESDRNKSATQRNNNAISGPTGVGERNRPIKNDARMKKKEEIAHDVSHEIHSQDPPRMKDDPLQKLKKMSETLKMERAKAFSRRASTTINFSSSESDYEPDGFRREIK